MTAPITPEEREEISNLAAEAEQPERLQVFLAELIRLRALASECRRNAGRLPRPVQKTLDAKVPKRTTAAEWARNVADSATIEDPRLQGAPRLI